MSENELTSGDFTEQNEPFALFATWLREAETTEPNDPNAVALATVDKDGLPNVRMVLLKGFDSQGFVFYTNFESQKGQEILSQKKAAMCFHWKSLRRQVRLRGLVEVVSDRKPTNITRRGLAAAVSAPGLPSNRAHSRAVSRWKRRLPNIPRAMPSATFHARLIGPVFVFGRCRSSSGTIVHSVCTTASNSVAKCRKVPGKRSGCIPD